MNDLLARACDLFVAPAVERRATPMVARLPQPDPSVAVLGTTPDVSALATSLARRLRRECHAPAAVVAAWEPAGNAQHAVADPDQNPAAPVASGHLAMPAAAALARRLAVRGLVARAAGRLVRVILPLEQDQCSAALARLDAARAETPAVTALCGPLAAWMVPVLAEHDRVLVHLAAEAAPELALLAVAGLADAGISSTPIAWTPGPLTRALVHRGLLACPAPAPVCRGVAR